MPRSPRNPPVRRARRGEALRLPSASSEDYLERIGELIEQRGEARMVEVARVLRVSRPSVTVMVQRLAKAGYVEYTRYRSLVLTEQGRAAASHLRRRHSVLKEFLDLLGMDEATQEDDIEGWEHCLSRATLDRIAQLTRFLNGRPAVLADFRRR
jgi:Mn-dependent DtxR family transcriptional regulator